MTQKLKQDIDDIVRGLVMRYKPEKIILFGSAARGDAGEDSDLDFLIIKSGVDHMTRADRYRAVARLFPTDQAVDALVYTPYEVKKRLYLGDPFIETVFREGMELYAA